MKKLMIAAAAAAMVGGAFADAIVYDIKISGKTATTARGFVQLYGEYDTGKVDKDDNPITKTGWYKYTEVDDNGKNVAVKFCYRKASTFSWTGVIAGCECDEETAVGPFAGALDSDEKENQIAAIWDTKAKAEVDAEFVGANFIRSGAKTDFVEAALGIAVAEDYGLNLMGHGKFDAKKGYLTSVNGNFIGELPFGGIYVNGVDGDCTLCDKEAGTDPYYCLPYEIKLCDSADEVDPVVADEDEISAAYAFGTWSLKYNSSKSKKLQALKAVNNLFTAEAIAKALGFPKYVRTRDWTVAE